MLLNVHDHVSFNLHTQSGESPLYTASFNGHQKCVNLLIEAGANVDVPTEVSVTSTHTSQRPPINMYQSIQCPPIVVHASTYLRCM